MTRVLFAVAAIVGVAVVGVYVRWAGRRLSRNGDTWARRVRQRAGDDS